MAQLEAVLPKGFKNGGTVLIPALVWDARKSYFMNWKPYFVLGD